MSRFFRFCCLAALLTLSAPAWAQTTSVDWSIGFQGDVLNIDAKTAAAAAPAQRLNASPVFLELAFPKAKMAGAALSKAVDKGLVQKVQTLQDGDKTVVRVFVLSKPKASLTKTAEGYRYSIRMSEPAGAASSAASKPPKPAVASSSPPAAATPPRVVTPPPTTPRVATPPAAANPPATPRVATPPVTATPPAAPRVATPPAAPRVATPPAANNPPATPRVASNPPAAATGRNAKTPITVVFENKPLAEAIREMAAKAGYTATVDPKVSGVVNLSISEMPFDEALAQLLAPYGDGVASDIGYTTVTVTRTGATTATPALAPANTTNPEPPTAASSAGGPIVYDYYPLANKDAKKVMDAMQLAIPGLNYQIDPVLNILLVMGPQEEVKRLGEYMKAMSNK